MVLGRLLSGFKNKIPGTIRYLSVSIGHNFTWPKPKKTNKPLISHTPAVKFEGYPGQYEQSPFTHIKLGPLAASICWKPFDYISEEEYYKIYGTYEPLKETKWEREKREKREKNKPVEDDE